MFQKHNARILLSVFVILTLLLVSCGSPADQTTPTSGVPGTGAENGAGVETPSATDAGAAGGEATMAAPTEPAGGAETPAEGAETPTEGAETPTGGAGEGAGAGGTGWVPEQLGGTLSVLAIWGGEEQDNFMAMIQPFIEQTGVDVQYESTRDLAAVLNTRISGGNPPDVAGLPNPGQMVNLARSGALKPLDDVLDQDYMAANFDPGFTELASVDGTMYGIFTKAAVKSLVWYNPQQFEANGYEIPTNWDEMNALEQQMIDDGFTPWCIGIDGGAGSGWPGTDWVEDIFLRINGPDVYDQWWQHEIPWTDPAVKSAFETWGEIVNDPSMVFGGQQYVIATNFGQAFVPMFEDPPSCMMHRQASFITTFFMEQFPDLQAGTDYTFFTFPPIDEQFGNPLLVAGDLFGMFNDTPQARSFMQYMTTAEAQAIWAERGGFISANRSMDPSVYPDEISQKIGEMIVEADAVRFDASDLMPEGVNSAFSQAVLQFVANPDQLDSILQQTESVAEGEYQQTQ
ncbi:MAG: carbohydrate ABC transporter substrate-binding protein [Chloroflexi bacterium]|nr:carbohydrate ABC transporter substrate-binding protein [Chloroflexota bacterium]